MVKFRCYRNKRLNIRISILNRYTARASSKVFSMSIMSAYVWEIVQGIVRNKVIKHLPWIRYWYKLYTVTGFWWQVYLFKEFSLFFCCSFQLEFLLQLVAWAGEFCGIGFNTGSALFSFLLQCRQEVPKP